MGNNTHTLRLKKLTGEKEPVIAWIVANLGIPRARAGELVYFAPYNLASGLPYSVADAYRQELELLGAVVEIIDTSQKVASVAAPSKKNWLWIVVLFLVVIIIVLLSKPGGETASHPRPPSVSSDWVGLSGNIWTGVNVYMGSGESKSLAFIVLGGNDKCSFGRGLYVQFPSGGKEWKDRDALIQNDTLFIRFSDQALKAEKWETYPCP